MNCRLKAVVISIGVILGAQLTGCSVSPKDPRSPYYTTQIGKDIKQTYSSKYVSKRQSPISSLDGSLESRLWKHFEHWRGTPYAYGGTGRNGIDCSAFVKITMQSVANIPLPRTTRTQIHVGNPISRNQLKPGDVVFFQTGANQMHNGIYMGQGKFMHASSSVGVTVSELNNPYWNPRYLKSIRVLS
ncbi:C40 family peptidase [Thiomicrorhabdus indica]|uniref:C40 family peptidase n=1 Tax=Thiomicrorhabdus indica TaxID=2267253 RepID=UPI00102DAF97|nr:NlpC/P60 family protein [Thiomicrorhabdus indica]